jgi:hypothetical protein
LRGFRRDIDEFQRFNGNGSLVEVGEWQSRILNPIADIAAVVTADLSARTIEYSYESDQQKTPVPEKGILVMRLSGNGVDLYSADQRLNPEHLPRATRRLDRHRNVGMRPTLSPPP